MKINSDIGTTSFVLLPACLRGHFRALDSFMVTCGLFGRRAGRSGLLRLWLGRVLFMHGLLLLLGSRLLWRLLGCIAPGEVLECWNGGLHRCDGMDNSASRPRPNQAPDVARGLAAPISSYPAPNSGTPCHSGEPELLICKITCHEGKAICLAQHTVQHICTECLGN